MSRLVPKVLAEALIARVSEQADRADWDHLTQSSKTEQLARWVEDPEIGGVLEPLVGGAAEIRMWLKEVALKRRARTLQPDPEAVVRHIFSEGVEVAFGTVGTKPHHASARNGAGSHYVAWGSRANAKHLFWAAINALEDDPELIDAWVVVVDTLASPTPADRRSLLEALATRCGLKIAWMTP